MQSPEKSRAIQMLNIVTAVPSKICEDQDIKFRATRGYYYICVLSALLSYLWVYVCVCVCVRQCNPDTTLYFDASPYSDNMHLRKLHRGHDGYMLKEVNR